MSLARGRFQDYSGLRYLKTLQTVPHCLFCVRGRRPVSRNAYFAYFLSESQTPRGRLSRGWKIKLETIREILERLLCSQEVL